MARRRAPRNWPLELIATAVCLRRCPEPDARSTIPHMAMPLLQPLCGIPLAFLDVETTGASAEFGDRVIEIGVARVEGERIVAEYEQLLDPQRRISAGVTVLTGITQEMVAGQPTFTDQLPRLMPLLEGAVVVGQNV